MKKIALIVNPRSGRSNRSKSLDKALHQLSEKYELQVLVTQRPNHAEALAKQTVKEGVDYVIAVGGDGTVNEVARALINTDVPLGIIPAGSGNGLALSLNIPRDIKKNLSIIEEENIIAIDYGIANDNVFFCTCGVGFDAHISDKFATSKKRGMAAYLECIAQEIFKYESENYRIEIDGKIIDTNAFIVTCANAPQYGFNAYIAPKAKIDDGLIDVTVVKKFPLAFAPMGLQLFYKHIDRLPYVKIYKAKEVKITRKNPGSFHYDGEPACLGTEIDVKIVRKGLKVLAPKL